jgi:hypothetical protein
VIKGNFRKNKKASLTSALVRGVDRAFDRSATGAGHVSGFVALFSFDDVKLYLLPVADAPDELLRVVATDRRLVDKDVFFRVIPLSKPNNMRGVW